jgi:hypothetical protein
MTKDEVYKHEMYEYEVHRSGVRTFVTRGLQIELD